MSIASPPPPPPDFSQLMFLRECVSLVYCVRELPWRWMPSDARINYRLGHVKRWLNTLIWLTCVAVEQKGTAWLCFSALVMQ